MIKGHLWAIKDGLIPESMSCNMPAYYPKAIIMIVVFGLMTLGFKQFYRIEFHNNRSAPQQGLLQQIQAHPLLYYQTIDINKATTEDLLAIPGIGPVLAQKITTFRLINGSFTQLSDLQQVEGIGTKTVTRLRQYCHIVPVKE